MSKICRKCENYGFGVCGKGHTFTDTYIRQGLWSKDSCFIDKDRIKDKGGFGQFEITAEREADFKEIQEYRSNGVVKKDDELFGFIIETLEEMIKRERGCDYEYTN